MNLRDVARMAGGRDDYDRSHRTNADRAASMATHPSTAVAAGPSTADVLAAIDAFAHESRGLRGGYGLTEAQLRELLLAWETEGRPR
jgi:hypothetical protein